MDLSRTFLLASVFCLESRAWEDEKAVSATELGLRRGLLGSI